MSSGGHWLTRPATIQLLWMLFGVILLATVIPEFVVDMRGHFVIDTLFGFNAWYGFATCVGMIVFAKLIGIFLKREETYYEE